MRWLRIGLIALGGVLALLLVAVALILTVDFGRFKPDIETRVSELLQRELRIDGVLHATIGSTIDIYAEDIFLANPEWANEAAFVTAEKIDISIDTWSLLKKPVQLKRAEIVGVDVNIESNDEGQASWTFEGLSDEPEPEQAKPAVRGDLPVIWDNVLLSNIDVSFNGSALETPVKIKITRGKGTISSAGYMETTVEGFLNDTPLSIADKSGPVENLLAMRDVQSELSGNIGEIVITGNALVDDFYEPTRPTLELNVDGPGAEYVTDMLKMPRVTEGPFGFKARVAPRDELLEVAVGGIFGEFELDINGSVADMQNLDVAELNVAASGPDISRVLAAFGIDTAEPDPFDVKGTVKRDRANLTIDGVIVSIGESKITVDGAFPKLPAVEGSHLALIATGPDYGRFNRLFGAPGALDGAFRTTLDLSPTDDNRTRIELNASAPDLSVNVSSRVSSQARFRDSTANVRIEGRDISKILAIYGIENLAPEAFSLKADISVDASGYLVEDARAIVGDEVLTVSGHIGDDSIAGETDLEIDLSGTDLGASVVALGGAVGGLPKGGYRLRGGLRKEDDRLYLREVNASIGDAGEYELTLDGFLTPQASLVGSELALKAHGASLAALADLAGVAGIPDFPFVISADFRRGAATTYINNGDFEVGTVKVGFSGHIGDDPMKDDMDFTLEANVPALPDVIAEFGVSPSIVPPGDLQLSVALHRKGGALTIDRLSGKLADVSMNVSGTVGDLPDLTGTSLQIDVGGPDLAAALPEQFRASAPQQAFAFKSKINMRKADLALDALNIDLGRTSVRGSVEVGRDPIMQHGEFSLTGSSPDLFELFPELKAQSVSQAAKMSFDGAGLWRDNLWTVDNVDLRLGDGRVQIRGSIDGPPAFDRTDLSVDMRVASLRNLSPLAGRELPDQSLSLIAEFKGTSERMTADGIQLTVGPSDLVGNFSLSAGEPHSVVLDIRSDLIDLSEFLVETDDSVQPAAKPKTEKDRLIPDTPLPMDALKSLNAIVNVDIAALTMQPQTFRDIRLAGQLQDGALRVDDVRVTGRQGGKLSGAFELRPDDEKGASFRAEFNGSELLLGLKADTEEDLTRLPVFSLFSVANAKGATTREMAGSLNAYYRLLSGSGRVKAGALDILTQDFLFQVIDTLNPFAKSDRHTNVVCAAMLIHSIDGLIDNKPALVMQTDKLRIKGDAKINLKNEKIDVTFSTVPQQGLGISFGNLLNPYIKVVGTMAQPSISLDPEGILVEGGVAVATGGVSILAKSLKDRFLTDGDACGKAVAEADKRYEDYRQAQQAKSAGQNQ